MQQFRLHKSIYKLNRLVSPEENIDPVILDIRNKVKTWQKLKSHKVPERDISKITDMSRASFYRRKKAIDSFGLKGLERKSKRPKSFRTSKIPNELVELILKLRLANPTYGKAKIHILLKRDHAVKLSESTVGRVIAKLLKQGKIKLSLSYARVKRRRKFDAYAKKWRYGMRATMPGELVQIDHMTVTKNNICMKHFQAWDPITKVIIADVVCDATSTAAAKFLYKVIEQMPFTIKSIQVDGGSEFMKYFEEACKSMKIELYVLPPSRPQYNGGVERGNRTFREEFYAKNILAESVGEFKYHLSKAVQKYNDYRPHFSLKGKTPFEYTAQILAA